MGREEQFMERGFTYFDTAVMYNGFASQRVAKEAILDRYPRDHIACGGCFAHWAHFCLYPALRAAAFLNSQ